MIMVKTIRDCVDKTGKLDRNRALIKLIDRYEISMAGARELMGELFSRRNGRLIARGSLGGFS